MTDIGRGGEGGSEGGRQTRQREGEGSRQRVGHTCSYNHVSYHKWKPL